MYSSKLIDKILYESKMYLYEKESNYRYGCVMLNLDFPGIKDLHSKIKKEDLYEEPDNDKYGLEKESHITLLYGLHKEVKSEEVKKILSEFDLKETIKFSSLSLFESEQDVLKLDVNYKLLSSINKKLRELPYTNKYDEYKPHMTIAYLKSGKGQYYVDLFKDTVFEAKAVDYLFKESNGKKNEIKL